MLQLFEFERYLFRQMIPSDRKRSRFAGSGPGVISACAGVILSRHCRRDAMPISGRDCKKSFASAPDSNRHLPETGRKRCFTNPRLSPRPQSSRALAKVILQRANLEIAGEIGPNSLRRGDRASEGRIVGHLMQESGAAQRPRIGEGLCAFRRIEHKLDFAVFDQVDDVRPAFRNLVDALRLYALAIKIARGAPGRPDLEAEPRQQSGGFEDARLVDVAHRNEDGACPWNIRAAAELALGESNRKRAIEADDLAGRAHFGPEHGIDAGKPGKRKYRFLDADMIETRPP